MLKKTENRVDIWTQPCLMPFEIGKLFESVALCFTWII